MPHILVQHMIILHVLFHVFRFLEHRLLILQNIEVGNFVQASLAYDRFMIVCSFQRGGRFEFPELIRLPCPLTPLHTKSPYPCPLLSAIQAVEDRLFLSIFVKIE